MRAALIVIVSGVEARAPEEVASELELSITEKSVETVVLMHRPTHGSGYVERLTASLRVLDVFADRTGAPVH